MSELIRPYRGHRTKQAGLARIARHLVPKYPEALSHDVGRPRHAPERLNRLIEEVRAAQKAWYVHSDLQKMAGGVSEAAARQLGQKLVARNVLRRLGRGLYGHPDASQPSPISLAQHVDWACKWPKPFLAFSSAMKLHDAIGPDGGGRRGGHRAVAGAAHAAHAEPAAGSHLFVRGVDARGAALRHPRLRADARHDHAVHGVECPRAPGALRRVRECGGLRVAARVVVVGRRARAGARARRRRR